MDASLQPILLLCLITTTNCGAVTLKGVLYSDEGGPSGSGTGEIRLAVSRKVREIRYQKPFSHQFSDSTCEEPGAIWTVNARHTAESNLEIASARCDGEVDPALHDSWLLVKRFLAGIQRNAPSAMEMISSEWRKSEQFKAAESRIKSFDLHGYSQFGRAGRCLEIVSAPGDTPIGIEAGLDCSLTQVDDPVSVRFLIAREAGSAKLVIGAIKFK